MMPSTAAELRRAGLVRALQAVHLAGGELSRAGLTRELACTRATAAALVADLADFGLLIEQTAVPTGRRGRPTPQVRRTPDGPAVVALEIGVHAVRIATVVLGGDLYDVDAVPLPAQEVDSVVAVARGALTARLRTLGARCAGAGVAVYGLVDRSSGVVVDAPHLGWSQVDLLAQLDLPTQLPVRIDNVANLIALADARRGHGREQETVLYVHAAVGVGGALVHHGRVLRGRSGVAGEYGHLPFGPTDVQCRCGAMGCWETEVDQLALARFAGRSADATTAAAVATHVIAAAADGERAAMGAVQRTGTALGRGVGALVNVHDPDLVVLAGHAAELQAIVPEVLQEAAHSAALRAHRGRMPSIVSAASGAGGTLVGAGELLFAELLSDPRALSAHATTGGPR